METREINCSRLEHRQLIHPASVSPLNGDAVFLPKISAPIGGYFQRDSMKSQISRLLSIKIHNCSFHALSLLPSPITNEIKGSIVTRYCPAFPDRFSRYRHREWCRCPSICRGSKVKDSAWQFGDNPCKLATAAKRLQGGCPGSSFRRTLVFDWSITRWVTRAEKSERRTSISRWHPRTL